MTYRNANTINKQIEEVVNNKLRKALDKGIDGSFAEAQKLKIVKRTQLGVGVNPDGTPYKFEPLSENYKEMRQGKARWYTDKSGKKIKVTKSKTNRDFVKKPKLAATTTPAKSNLTATGQLLKSLTTVKVRMSGGIKWIIRVGDNRGRGLFGYPSTIGNRELVNILARKGRRFMDFTTSQKNQMAREIRLIILKYLK
jgi:hypothetical protein